MSDIRKRRIEIQTRIKQHKAKGLILEAELEGLQLECDHPNLRKWTHHDYGGGSDRHECCDDCGYHKVR
jgi:hypothetical protein